MTAQHTLAAARADFAAGRIPRDELWRVSAECYVQLRERTPLNPDGDIRAIRADEGHLFVELRNGLKLWWDPRDVRTAPNWILNHGSYERTEMAVLTSIASQAQVVLDVGANIGWYTLHLARQLAASGGRVIAFEPIPVTFHALKRNVSLNELGSVVTLMPVGLSDSSADLDFFVPDATGSVAASQRQLFEKEANARVPARVERLDDLVGDLGITRLDLIKCDVEGGELLMLRGGLETIRRFRPMLFLELLRKWSKAYGYHPNDVISLLAAEGYSCWAIADAGLEAMPTMREDCAHTNFLFMHGAHGQTREAVHEQLRTLGRS
jgi:FkbM family methyltransferase